MDKRRNIAKLMVVFLIFNLIIIVIGINNIVNASVKSKRNYINNSSPTGSASTTFNIPSGSTVKSVTFCIYELESSLLKAYADGSQIYSHSWTDHMWLTRTISTNKEVTGGSFRVSLSTNSNRGLHLSNDRSYVEITYEEKEADTDLPYISIHGVSNDRTYTSSVRPSFSASDSSGIRSISATLNGSHFSSGSLISTSGSKILRVTATDKAGNTETKVVRFTLDLNDNPVLNLTTLNNQVFSENPGYDKLIIKGSVRDDDVGDSLNVKYTIKDNRNSPLSGHNNRIIQSNISANGSNKSFNNLTIDIDSSFVESNYTLEVWAEDNKGGKSSVVSRNFKVDKTGPAITTSLSEGDICQNTTPPTFSSNDPSSIKAISATINGEAYTSGALITTGGKKTLVISATDKVGNTAQKTIDFYLNFSPHTNISSLDNQILSEKAGYNEFIVEGTMQDDDIGDNLTVYYTIEDSLGNPVIGQSIIAIDSLLADGNIQRYNNYTISIDSTLSQGEYIIKIWCEDDKLGKSNEVSRSFKVDKTAPIVNVPTLNAISDTEIQISSHANDPNNIHTTPYLYNRDEADISLWIDDNPYSDIGLAPNTQYSYKFKARDIVDNESEYSPIAQAYTLALNPENIEITNSDGTSITFTLTNVPQGQAPEHRLELKLKGAGQSGDNVSTSDWSSETTRILTGLTRDTEYELWVTTRNGDQKENTKYLAIGTLTSNIPPNLNITDLAVQQIIKGHESITISGKAWDGDGDNLTISASIDGVAKSMIVDNAPTTEPGADNYTLNWTAEELKDGIYADIIINATDDSTIAATSNDTYIGNLVIDKVDPSSTISGNPTEWTSSDITLKVSADDATSGVKRIQNPDLICTNGASTSYPVMKNGDYRFVIEDNAGNSTMITETVNRIDKVKPKITGIYTYKGAIYVIGEDGNQLHSKPYGFEFLAESKTLEELLTDDESGFEIKISADSIIPAGTKIFKTANSINTEIPINMKFILRDIAENEGNVTLTIDDANKVYYGTVPQDVLDMINEEIRRLNPPKRKPEITQQPEEEIIIVDPSIDEEMKKAIEKSLDSSEIIENDAPLNSEYAQITININDYLDKKYNGLVGYRLDVIQKDSMELVYTMLLESAEKVELPKLSDSTTYIIRIAVVNSGKELAFREIERITKDRTAPIIEKISINQNGMLAVKATDNIGLHAKSYKYELKDGQIMNENGEVAIEITEGFEIVNLGYIASLDMAALDASNWKFKDWVSESRIKVNPGAKLKIKVRDKEGNYTETEEIVADEGTLQRLINEDNPMKVDINAEIYFKELINKIIDSNLVDGEKINLDKYKVELPSDKAEVIEGKLIIKDLGTIIISFINNETGERIQYMLEAVVNLQFDRRIIVRTNSQTELSRAFEKILFQAFKTNKGINFESNSDLIEIDRSILKTNKEGIAKVTAEKSGRSINLYILISDTISGVLSNIDVIKDNIGYTILKDKEIDVVEYLEMYSDKNASINSNYVVVEAFNPKFLEAKGRIIKGTHEGITSIRVIDLVKGVIKIADLKVVALENKADGFADIENHWAEKSIENLMKHGIVEASQDKTYMPDEFITAKEFLVLLNRYKLFTDIRNEKILKDIRLNKSDSAYYDIANVLSGMTLQEAEYIETFNDFDEKLTREEAFYIISRVVDLSEYEINDIEEIDSKYNAEIKNLIAIGALKGYEDGTYRVKNRMTRGEAASLIDRLIELNSTIFAVE